MKRPAVDIIIPYHGKYELVARCVGGIVNHTPNQDYRIFLVDDHSPNPTFLETLLKMNKRITGVRTQSHVGFAAALAEGFKLGTNTNVVFMHSDVYCDNIYWLANLQRAMTKLKNQGVKLVSSRTDNAGTAMTYDERLVGLRTDEMPAEVIVESPLPLFCCYMNRELFNRIGGFLRPYKYGWYEDEELFYRMRYYGYKQAIIPSSYVHHDGGGTINELISNHKIRAQMEANREICLGDVTPYLRG